MNASGDRLTRHTAAVARFEVKQMHNVAMTDLSLLGSPVVASAPTLVEGIQFSLREAITKGDLPAGFRLREIPLAAHFGCSTTPVREALRRLEHEGLVKVHPRRGAEVSSVSAAEVDHLYEIRMVLEIYAVRKAAEVKPSEGALAAVRKVVDEQRQLIGTDDEDGPRLDYEFHREVTALAGNPVIADTVGRTVRQIEAVQARSQSVVKGERARTCDAHDAIVNAVAKGKADRAETLMREHMERVRHVVTESLHEQPSTDG